MLVFFIVTVISFVFFSIYIFILFSLCSALGQCSLFLKCLINKVSFDWQITQTEHQGIRMGKEGDLRDFECRLC